MPSVDLRHAHPMFFVSIVSDLVVWLGAGLAVLLGPDIWVSSSSFDPMRDFMPMRAWGGVFVALGVMLLYGVRYSWRWARRSMQLGAIVVALFAASFVVLAFQDKNTGITGIAFWLAYGINLLAQTGEPPTNPASVRRT